MSAAATRPRLFLRRSLAWLLDFAMVGALATAAAWHWVASAAPALVATSRALADDTSRRLVDGMLDGTPAPALVHALTRDPALQAAAEQVQSALWSLFGPWCLAYAVLAFAWHVAGDLSPWQASPGKRAFGLRVAGAAGAAPTPKQAALREAASALSWLSLNLGHLLALVPPQRRSLHDRIAGTRVVPRDAGGPTPAAQASMLPPAATGEAASGSPSSICRHAK